MSLLSRVVRTVPTVPIAAMRFSLGVASASEKVVLGLLANRLRALDSYAGPPALERTQTSVGVREESAPDILAGLLQRSLRSDTEIGRADHATAILKRLVPDEARIMAALAGGEGSPVVHVFQRAGGRPVLLNASTVGRTAAVTLPSRTPQYVSHLLSLGLVVLGPEIPAHKGDFELLLAERLVRHALREGSWGKVPARVVRGSLRISGFGAEVWTVASASSRDGEPS